MYFFRKRKTRKKFCLFFTLTEKNGIVSIGKVKKELRESKNTDGRACILTTWLVCVYAFGYLSTRITACIGKGGEWITRKNKENVWNVTIMYKIAV